MKLAHLLFITCFVFAGCAPQRISAISGGEYDENKGKTDYFVLPFGSTSLPGKWDKKRYNEVSKQQFFENADHVSIAIAFTPINSYEFNRDNSKTGYAFTKAFYQWEADYFVNAHKLNQAQIETNEDLNYIIWRVYGPYNNSNLDTYFLFGEKNGYASNFSVTITDKWSTEQKIKVLKEMYLQQQK